MNPTIQKRETKPKEYFRCPKCKKDFAYSSWRKCKKDENFSICPNCQARLKDTLIKRVKSY